MKLTGLLDKRQVFPGIGARTMDAALQEMLDRLDALGGLRGARVSKAELLKELLDRERKGSTALGEGVAYPHMRHEGVQDFVIALATAPDGIDYGAPGGEHVRLILLAIAPPDKNSLLLSVVVCLSRIMGDKRLLSGLVHARDEEEAWKLLDSLGLVLTESIAAGDIMKRVWVGVSPDMSLSEIASLMHRERQDVLPVVDKSGKLMGEISAREVFAACLPRYFTEIPSLKFVRDFDVFAHFLRERAHVKVEQIIRTDIRMLDPETPLSEVVAHLARAGVTRLYVVEAGKLVGVIDNFSVIDKVLSI